PRDSNRNWSAVASSADGSKLIAAVGDGSFGQLYTSTDFGATWVPRETNRNWSSVASSAGGTRLIAAAAGVDGTQGLFVSQDSGVTWQQRGPATAYGAVAASADGTRMVACSLGSGIYSSLDSGTTWTLSLDVPAFWSSITSSSDGGILAAVI